MILIPGHDWNWRYKLINNKQHLTLKLVADDGSAYDFITHYCIEDLRELPSENQSFSVEDGTLLTAFQQGLYEIGVKNDLTCLEIGLNAVACARFCRIPSPVGRYFTTNSSTISNPTLGQVVSLYSVDGAIGDFIVLDSNIENDNDVVRLMLANPNFEYAGHFIKIGQMIRVSKSRLNYYRLANQVKADYA